jgi:TRAP-type C4-dicarboxylate transport system permease small subunit
MPLRRALNTLYALCGGLAAVFLCLIAILIGAQVVGRFFGLVVPAANELAGFSLAASTFLALPYAFRSGAHIRVNLLLLRLPPAGRRGADVLCLAAGIALIGYFAWYALKLVQDSIRFGEVSSGLVGIPLAIPQAAMVIGGTVLLVAMLDELIWVLRGGTPSFEAAPEVDLDPATNAEPASGPSDTDRR